MRAGEGCTRQRPLSSRLVDFAGQPIPRGRDPKCEIGLRATGSRDSSRIVSAPSRNLGLATGADADIAGGLRAAEIGPALAGREST